MRLPVPLVLLESEQTESTLGAPKGDDVSIPGTIVVNFMPMQIDEGRKNLVMNFCEWVPWWVVVSFKLFFVPCGPNSSGRRVFF